LLLGALSCGSRPKNAQISSKGPTHEQMGRMPDYRLQK
jgi:hypothetical protein